MADVEGENGKNEVTGFVGCGLYRSLGFPIRTYMANCRGQGSLSSGFHVLVKVQVTPGCCAFTVYR